MRHFGPLFPKAKNYFRFISLILALGATAQVQNGQIAGVVADPSGAVVAGHYGDRRLRDAAKRARTA
jgi:hypothetical protein